MLSFVAVLGGSRVRVLWLACLAAACSTPNTPGDAGAGDAGPMDVDEGTPEPDLGPDDSFVPCPEPSGPCVAVVREDGECVEQPLEDGTACDDGSLCTTEDFCDEGRCGGTPVVCDEIACQTDPVCDPATGECGGTPVVDGTLCDDGNLCTRDETCQSGACRGAERPNGWACDDGNGCTNLDICTDGVCVGTRPLPEGAGCEDGDLCTVGDICVDGACQPGPPNECSGEDLGACLTEACDPLTGDCRFTYADDGTPCDDKNICTTGDTCLFGGCSGTPTVPAAGTCAGPFCFRDGTVAAGFEGTNMNAGGDVGGGAAIFDPDEDGDMDVLFVTDRFGSSARPDPQGYLHYFENDGSGGFTEATTAAFGAFSVGDTGPQGLLVADLDGDGHDDVYVYGRGDNYVLKGAGDGTFTDVTATAGLAGGDAWTTAASVADFDGDGDLDLYEGNYIRRFSGPDHEPEPNRFYRNDGDGTFTDVSALFPVLVSGEDLTLSVVFTDIDGDGDEDLMVCNDFGEYRDPNKLFRNEGDGTFTDVSVPTNFRDGFFCMSIAPGDYDRDGDLDYYLSNIGVNRLLRWDGTAFIDDGARAMVAGGPDECFPGSEDTSWAGRFVDFDHDGWLDLYLNNGDVGWTTSAPDDQNQVWHHQGTSLTFRSEGVDARAAYTERDRGAAFGDLDGDGDVDVISVRSIGYPLLLWNESPKVGSYLRVDLRGDGMDPVGARVVVETNEGEEFVSEYRRNDGYGSSSEPVLHVGLGVTTGVREVRVTWPDGDESVVSTATLDSTLRIDEPAPTR